MTKRHVNPETGAVGVCSAKIKCEFADLGAEHFDNKKDAEAASEKILSKIHGNVGGSRKVVDKNDIAKPAVTGDLAQTVTKLDTDSVIYHQVLTNQVQMSEKDRVAFMKDPDNPKSLRSVERSIVENYGKERFDELKQDAALGNFIEKTYLSGADVAPEITETYDENWNDNGSYFGRKQTTERYAMLNDAVADYEKFGKVDDEYNDSSDSESPLQGAAWLYHQRNEAKRSLETEGRSSQMVTAMVTSTAMQKVANRLLSPKNDLEEAKRDTIHSFANERRWENLMGANKNRTDKNTEEFHKRVEADLTDEEKREYNSKALKRANHLASRRFFARSYKEGNVLPLNYTINKAFEKEWKETGEKKAHAELAELHKLNESLDNGKITPAKVIGTGYRNPKKMAKTYLTNQIEAQEENIKTRGRSDASVLRNFKHKGLIPNDFGI